MPTPPFDTAVAQRWFAIELNNFTWNLLETENRSEDDTERMLHTAHAAWYHWQAVGTPVNTLRAYCLLATAYVSAGNGLEAVSYAEKSLALSEQLGDSQTTFDRATAYGCAARAYALAGNRDFAREYHRQAAAVAETFDDADDRLVFDRFYPAP